MIKVGLIPTAHVFTNNNPYSDTYTFYNIYTKRLYEIGALPVGILLNDGKLDIESLKMCDALLIGGGNKIEPYFLEVINYAVKNNVPLLGICLGMQSIGVYSYLETLLKQQNKDLTVENFWKEFQTIKDNKVMFLNPVQNHYNEKITRDNYPENKHGIRINTTSKLYAIFQKEEMDVVSMHRYVISKYGERVLINCDSDGIIEGLEYKDDDLFILGVQWHPELEENNNVIFKSLIKEAKKRK